MEVENVNDNVPLSVEPVYYPRVMENSSPVSYTHLDVYKRQIVTCACVGMMCFRQVLLKAMCKEVFVTCSLAFLYLLMKYALSAVLQFS